MKSILDQLDKIKANDFSKWAWVRMGMIHADWKYRRYSDIRHAAETLPRIAWEAQQAKIEILEKALRIALKELNECCACDEYQCDYCFALKEIEALFKGSSEEKK